MLVVVAVVLGMAVTVVHIVGVVPVRHAVVAATRAVVVLMVKVGHMTEGMLVVVVFMRGVRMALVDVVDMAFVLDGGVAAAVPVVVGMLAGVAGMVLGGCHNVSFFIA